MSECPKCGGFYNHDSTVKVGGWIHTEEICLRNQLSAAQAENERLREIKNNLIAHMPHEVLAKLLNPQASGKTPQRPE